MIVLDASAAVEWLLGLPLARAVDERLCDDQSVHAPHLLSVEVCQVLRRYRSAGDLSGTRAARALDDLTDMDLVRHPHEPLLALMWSHRENITAYDAAYVALAEALDAPLVTLDRRLARSPGMKDSVDLIT